MKSTAPVFLGLVGLLIGASANATTVTEAKVPFPFSVRGQVLPAGQYRIERDTVSPSVVTIRGEHGVRASAMTLSTQANGQDPAGNKQALVFKRDETGYRLASVWDDTFSGREIPKR